MNRIYLSGAWLLICLLIAPAGAAELSAREHFNRGSVKYLYGDLAAAEKELRAALALEPQLAGASQLLKNVLNEKARLQAAQPSPASFKARMINEYLAAGKFHFQRQELTEAAVLFKGALAADSGNKEAREYLDRITRVLAEREAATQREYWLALAGLVAALLVLATALPLLLFVFKRDWLDHSFIRRAERRCGKCHARLSAKADFCPNCGARLGSNVWNAVSRERLVWYQQHHWKHNPFSLDIYPELFTGYQREIKKILEKVSAESGHVLITGPLGIGKTTMLRWLATSGQDFHPVYIARPPQDFSQVIRLIAQSLGLTAEQAARYDIYSLDSLRRQIDRNLVLLLDEAHEFSIEIERPLRTLGDLDRVKLVMAGLPETKEKIKNEIRPLYERLVLSIDLDRLDNASLGELIKVRIENSGGRGTEPFTDDALDQVYALAQGNPRTALKICDWAVTRAINTGAAKINAEIVAAYGKGGEHVQG
ncbi:MAG: AAA family ATPase [Candidatus Margulisbacteria bacterium]|jgi:type II secretory pathway predicted ATPase ExeA|nr:AAA family ATPase [Candidatus Margulisiibacteriota bacterium]